MPVFNCTARSDSSIWQVAQEAITTVQLTAPGTVLVFYFNDRKIKVGRRTTIASIFRQAGFASEKGKINLVDRLEDKDYLPNNLPEEPALMLG